MFKHNWAWIKLATDNFSTVYFDQKSAKSSSLRSFNKSLFTTIKTAIYRCTPKIWQITGQENTLDPLPPALSTFAVVP